MFISFSHLRNLKRRENINLLNEISRVRENAAEIVLSVSQDFVLLTLLLEKDNVIRKKVIS